MSQGGGEPAGELKAALERDFGGFPAFRRQFNEVAGSIMGSGWAALVWEPLGARLLIKFLVQEAVDAGVTFFDNAWEYNAHRSEEWMGLGLQGRRDKIFLMTKVCTHGRDKKVAMQQLDDSLKRLRTDHWTSGRFTRSSMKTIRTCTSPTEV